MFFKLTDNNKLNVPLAQITSNSTTVVDLSNQPLLAEDITQLCKALANNKSVTKFILRNCHLNDGSINQIASLLSSNTPLLELDLSDNMITDDGLILLVDALTNPALFNQHRSSYGVIHAELNQINMIKHLVGVNTQLTTLIIRNNLLKNESRPHCIQQLLLGNATIKKLDLKDNPFDSEIQQALIQARAYNDSLDDYDCSTLTMNSPTTHILRSQRLGGFPQSS